LSIKSFYKSTIGKKIVVALSGLFLFSFVVGHMAGNLKAYAGYGKDGVHKLDHYAEFLRTIGSDMIGHNTFLWGFRCLLIIALVLHVVNIIQLQLRNRKGRTTKYAVHKKQSSSFSSKFMMYGGLIILAFVILHILHFTTGSIHFDNFKHGAVYQNIYSAFSKPLIVVLYLISMIAVSLHLKHGIWSVFQTLGLNNSERNKVISISANIISLVVFLGFITVPLGILFGFLPEPL